MDLPPIAGDGVAVYGSRKGPVLLGDTGLVVEVESDASKPGEEFVEGFGRTARDGLHILAATARETCDLVVSNALLIDAIQGSQGIRRSPRRTQRRRRKGRQPENARRPLTSSSVPERRSSRARA